MPTIDVAVSHRLSQYDALRRIRHLLSDVSRQYAGRITNLQENWDGYICTFSFTTFGFSVSGTLSVWDTRVELTGNIPRLAMVYKNRIIATIKERAETLLAPADNDEEPRQEGPMTVRVTRPLANQADPPLRRPLPPLPVVPLRTQSTDTYGEEFGSSDVDNEDFLLGSEPSRNPPPFRPNNRDEYHRRARVRFDLRWLLIIPLAIITATIGMFAGINAYRAYEQTPSTASAPDEKPVSTKPATVPTPPAEAQQLSTADADATAATTAAQRRTFENSFKSLETDKPGILAQAQQADEACEAVARLKKYENFEDEVNKSNGASDIGLGTRLKSAIGPVGREATSAMYAKMIAGKPLDCKGVGSNNEADFVEQVVVWMDRYGSKSERFEPAVVRDAYLRAIKPVIKDALGELARSRYSYDESEIFNSLVERAQKWKLSLDELAVPIEVRTRLNLK